MRNKELIDRVLTEFFKAVDEVVTPVLVGHGFKRKILKGRCVVFFEQIIGDKISTIDFFCYIKYGQRAFRATWNSAQNYLHVIRKEGSPNVDDPWKYENESQLKTLLSEVIRKIEEQKLLSIEGDSNGNGVLMKV